MEQQTKIRTSGTSDKKPAAPVDHDAILRHADLHPTTNIGMYWHCKLAKQNPGCVLIYCDTLAGWMYAFGVDAKAVRYVLSRDPSCELVEPVAFAQRDELLAALVRAGYRVALVEKVVRAGVGIVPESRATVEPLEQEDARLARGS